MRTQLISRTSAPRRRLAGVAALAAAALVMAGCSSDDDEPAANGGADGEPETTELLVGIVPVVDHAAVFRAIEAGYFEDEGLDVTAQPAQGGAAAVPAMIAGDMQAAFATYPSFILAESSGIGITIVAEGVRGTEETAGVYVDGDSDIQSIADLSGRTIAVNTLNNTGDITIRQILQENDVDLSTVQFIELPFADMGPTLASGGVDAVWLVEPFRTNIEAEGGRKIFATYEGTTADIPVSGVAMTDSFVADNPNTVAGFTRALNRANADLAEDPDLARELVTTYSSTTEELAQQLQLPRWSGEPAAAANLEIWNELMTGQGILDDAVDLDGMVYQLD